MSVCRIIDSTDGRHIGEAVDPAAAEIVFADGGKMAITVRAHVAGVWVLANSNYIIQAEEE